MAYLNRDEFLAKFPQEKVYGYIYVWTNKINGKQYVGQVVSHRLDIREQRHLHDTDTVFDKAIHKYGEENFERKLIDVANSREELDEKEILWIKEYGTFGNGYNCTSGGKSCIVSEETKRKVSKAVKGKNVGSKNGRYKAPIKVYIRKTMEFVGIFESTKDIEKNLLSIDGKPLKHSNVSFVLTGKRSSHGGYFFERTTYEEYEQFLAS